jgi:hypothetical protein
MAVRDAAVQRACVEVPLIPTARMYVPCPGPACCLQGALRVSKQAQKSGGWQLEQTHSTVGSASAASAGRASQSEPLATHLLTACAPTAHTLRPAPAAAPCHVQLHYMP